MTGPFSKHICFLTALLFILSASLIAAGADALSPSSEAAALSLNGTAFQDADGDGFFSPGEVGLANITIRAIREGMEVSNATTNESGQYFFGNLSPGKYKLRADPFSGGNLTAPGSGYYGVTLSDKSGFGLDYAFFAPSKAAASLPARAYPIMRPTREEADLWAGQYNASDRAYLSPQIATKMASMPVTSFSLLDRLTYTPSERDQGSCGNCWAWAGTGVMELDYARQKSVSDRLSVQYLNSNYNDGCGDSGACCGGWLTGLTSFYEAGGMMIPWSNANAHYRDGRKNCGSCSIVSASSISDDPHYDLKSISTSTVPTHAIDREAAISNIKNVLLQGKGIWFAFYLPDGSAWNDFFSFWKSQPESGVWKPDVACGKLFDYKNGGGHAVLCVGYDDTDPNNRYWIMLNSWGVTSGRPSGLFRVDVDMDYDCTYGGLGYAFYWMTLDMSYPERENNVLQTPSLPQGPVQGAILDSLSYTTSTSDSKGGSSLLSDVLDVTIAFANQLPLKPARPQGTAVGISQKPYNYTTFAGDPDGDDVFYTFDWGDANTSQTTLVNSGTKVQMQHTWSLAGTYPVRVMATDCNGAESPWSAIKTVKIYKAPRTSKARTSVAAKAEKTKAGRACPCSKYD